MFCFANRSFKKHVKHAILKYKLECDISFIIATHKICVNMINFAVVYLCRPGMCVHIPPKLDAMVFISTCFILLAALWAK
jgi:hypothetical protein